MHPVIMQQLAADHIRELITEAEDAQRSRQPRLRETPKASGFNGQIVELLRYRGLLDRIEAASGRPVRAALRPRSAVRIWTSHTWQIPRYG